MQVASIKEFAKMGQMRVPPIVMKNMDKLMICRRILCAPFFFKWGCIFKFKGEYTTMLPPISNPDNVIFVLSKCYGKNSTS